MKQSRRFSGTFWAEFVPTIFFCVFLQCYWSRIIESWDVMDIPLLLLAVLYPAKILLMIWLRRQGGDSWDYGHSGKLVTSGLYRFTRNPVYEMVMAQFVVWLFLVLAIMIQNDVWTDQTAHPVFWVISAAVALAWFWLYADTIAIPREEKTLAEDHPAEFAAYRRRVGRWLFAPRAEEDFSEPAPVGPTDQAPDRLAA